MFGPFMAKLCYPHSTPEQDAIKGKWVRVNKDLNRQSGLWRLVRNLFHLWPSHLILLQNIYYRRTRRLDISLVTDLKLLSGSQSPPSTERWIKISRSIRDGVSGEPPLYLWYRTGKTVKEMSVQEKQEDLITELDVLYGADRPWYGFYKLEPSVTIESGRVSSEWITYRKGVKRAFFASPQIFAVLICYLQDHPSHHPFTSHTTVDSKFSRLPTCTFPLRTLTAETAFYLPAKTRTTSHPHSLATSSTRKSQIWSYSQAIN